MPKFSVAVTALITVVVDADDRLHARECANAFVEGLSPTPDYICGYNSVQSGGTIEADETRGFDIEGVSEVERQA